jgi:hypothetical protein
VAYASTINVPIDDTMAKKPVKGKMPHGLLLRHGEVKFVNASGSTWMNPVARITPAAKALMMKKESFSGLRARNFLPSNGMHTPAAPATRMEAIEHSLYLSAVLLLLFVFPASSHVQSPYVVGRKIIRINSKFKM